jgi:hypothetical protein
VSDLQFETAEGTAPGTVVCAVCTTPLDAEYHDLNGQTVCQSCRVRAETEYARDLKPRRFFVAAAYGAGAAIVGGLLYWGFVKVTNIELGLMAIAVGWLVGKAIMKGSNYRGGRRYQILGVVLTYLAIAMSYGALMFGQVLSLSRTEQTPSRSADMKTSALDTSLTDTSVRARREPATSAAPTAATQSATDTLSREGGDTLSAARSPTSQRGEASKKETSPDSVLFALGALALLFVASPFLAGFENIIGWVIIAIGLWEAWRHTTAVPFMVGGPHRIMPTEPKEPRPSTNDGVTDASASA